MNPHDLLEADLRAMKPRASSAELKRQIVERLTRRTQSPPYRSWGVAMAGALAAACLAAISMWWSNERRERTNDVSHSLAVSPTTQAELAPTIFAYRQALLRSREHFTDLLDKHAMVTLPHDPARNGIRAFIRPDVNQPSWIGEL